MMKVSPLRRRSALPSECLTVMLWMALPEAVSVTMVTFAPAGAAVTGWLFT